jgi:hypothetical protein
VVTRRALGRPAGGGVEQDGLADAGEPGEQFADGQAQAGLGGLAAHQVGDLQGQDAGEDVDADVVLGPVMHWGEGHYARVLELAEGELGLGLGPVAGDHLGGGPLVVVGDQDVLAEDLLFQGGAGACVDAPGKPQVPGLFPGELPADHPAHPWFAGDRGDLGRGSPLTRPAWARLGCGRSWPASASSRPPRERACRCRKREGRRGDADRGAGG